MSSSGQAGPAGTVQPTATSHVTGATGTGNAILPPAPHQHQPAAQQNLNQIVGCCLEASTVLLSLHTLQSFRDLKLCLDHQVPDGQFEISNLVTASYIKAC